MNKDTIRQIMVVVTTIATITVNALANTLPLNGLETGEISDRFAIYFVPAGYVFSIWGLIYILLIAYTVYQALPAQRENAQLQQIGYLYMFSGMANILWLFLWHYEVFSLTLFAMLAILGLLIAIYLRLGFSRQDVTAGFRWFVQLPFSVYMGWITVATVANTSQLLYFLGWGGWGISPEVWTVIMLIVTALLTAAMLFTRSDIAYGLVIVWAVIGIALKHAGVPEVNITSWIVTGVLTLLVVIQLVKTITRGSETNPSV